MLQNRKSRALVSGMMAFLAGGTGCCTSAGAQRAEPLPIESALKTRSFGESSPLAFSPDGKWIAYMVRDNERSQLKKENETEHEYYVRTGRDLRNDAGDIFVSNTGTGKARSLTAGRGSNWGPSWSPDGRYLAFLSDRDGSGQARLWSWDSNDNTLRLLTSANVRAPYLCPGMRWTPDSRRILITIVPEKLDVGDFAHRVSSPADTLGQGGAVSDATVMVFRGPESTPASSQFNLDAFYFHDLALVDVVSGKTTTVVRDRRLGWWSLSPDGSRVAFAVPKRLHPPGRVRRDYDFLSVDLATLQERHLASDRVLGDAFGWSPDGSLVVYGEYGVDRASYDFFAVSPDGGPSRKVASLPQAPSAYCVPLWGEDRVHAYVVVAGALWRFSVSAGDAIELAHIPERKIIRTVSRADGLLWTSDSGRSTVVVAHDDEGKRDGFYKIDLTTGQSVKLLENEQCYSCRYLGSGFSLNDLPASRESVAYIAEDAGHAPELWVSDSSFRRALRLTHLNPQFENYRMGPARLIGWLGEDGEPLHGALLLPSDYQAGKRYPLIVYVYPARLSNDFDQFGFGGFPGPFNLQLFATRGYAVLLPDAQKENRNGMFSVSKSVLPGVNAVIEMGVADSQRIGVMGHSAGGYAALALISQTNRFKAALDAAGFSDWNELYGLMWRDGVAYHTDEIEAELGGNPWQYPMRYIERSPISHLDRVETPLLIVHGTADGAVPSFLSDQVFVGMRQLGKEVEYARYERESHVPRDWSYPNQVDVCRRAVNWFGTYLKVGAP